MKKLVVGLLVVAAACGGDDDTASTTVAAGQVEACAAMLATYGVAVEAWYASGRIEHPDVEALIAERFVDRDTPAGYVEVVAGSGDTPTSVVAGPDC